MKEEYVTLTKEMMDRVRKEVRAMEKRTAWLESDDEDGCEWPNRGDDTFFYTSACGGVFSSKTVLIRKTDCWVGEVYKYCPKCGKPIKGCER
jgi:hypothetical protein